MSEKTVMEKKCQLYEAIDHMAEQLTEMADFIFDHPETDGNEVQAAALLTDVLKKNGFTVETGCGGLKTAFRGVYHKMQAKDVSPELEFSVSMMRWRIWDMAADTICRVPPVWEQHWQ